MKLSPAPMVSMGCDEDGGDVVSLAAALDDGSAGAAFDYDERDARGEGVESLFERGLVGYFEELVFVG